MEQAALQKAVLQWAEDKGIMEWASPQAQFMKTVSEVGELADALAKGTDKEEIIDAIGDIQVTLIILAELLDLDYTGCLAQAYQVISGRTGQMVNGVFVKDED